MLFFCCCSVPKSCLTLRPMDYSTPGFSAHYLPEFVQTHVCWVHDTIPPSHPQLPPSPPAFNLFQHQGLFQWVGPLHLCLYITFCWILSVGPEISLVEISPQHREGKSGCPTGTKEQSTRDLPGIHTIIPCELVYIQDAHRCWGGMDWH